MPSNVLKTIGKSTAKMAYKSSLYHWSISGDVPDQLLVKPVDPWPGNPDGARFFCSGSLVIDEQEADLHAGWHALRSVDTDGWEPKDLDSTWIDYMHGFSWLRDLKALGGDVARRTARTYLLNWMQHYGRWCENSWKVDVTGERVALWIGLYNFFGASADDEFQKIFFEAAICQARHLARSLPGEAHGLGLLKGIKGLLYAGLAFEGYESWIEQALTLLRSELRIQILPDGGHVSRSPEQLMRALQILLDVRAALAAAKYPLPEHIQHAIDKMAPALKFFRYSDKHFALFHGSQEGDQALVDCVLAQAKTRGKALQHLPATGFEKLTIGRSALMVDCSTTPDNPHDKDIHASPLAFEMCYGKERLFVSCGAHPYSGDWQEALRATAAHNTATLNHRNACEIKEDGSIARKIKNISVHKEADKANGLLEVSHDGYVPLNGMTHRRRFFLTDGGNDLRGEDTFSCTLDPDQPIELAIRFHIHPKVLVSLVRDDTEALLRLGSGTGWRFFHSGGVLALENSIYLGEGSRPRKTKQLVLYSQITSNQTSLKWGMKRTG